MRKCLAIFMILLTLPALTFGLTLQDLKNAVVGTYLGSAFVEKIPLWAATFSDFVSLSKQTRLEVTLLNGVQQFEISSSNSKSVGYFDYENTGRYQGFVQIMAVFLDGSRIPVEILSRDFDSIQYLADGSRISHVDSYLRMMESARVLNYGDRSFILVFEGKGNWFYVKESR